MQNVPSDGPPDPRELERALAAFEVAQENLLAAEKRMLAAGGPPGSILFRLNEGLFWFPSDQIRCVANTKNGRRCRNEVFEQGQVWGWHGPFALIDEEWVGRLLSQTCRVHDDGRATYGQPEWVRISTF